MLVQHTVVRFTNVEWKLAVIAASKFLKQVFRVVRNESLFDRYYYKKIA